MENTHSSVSKLILVPCVITTFVTAFRLIGEALYWPAFLFSRAAGGGFALVGVSWLAIVFGIYFALKLSKSGIVYESGLKTIGITILSLVVLFGGFYLIFLAERTSAREAILGAGTLVVLGAIFMMRVAWPAYWNALIAYALAARIPVIVVMYFAIKGNWGTHYDVAPPGMSFADWYTKWVQIGFLPQLLFWIPFTVIFCGLLGILTVALLRRGHVTAAA